MSAKNEKNEKDVLHKNEVSKDPRSGKYLTFSLDDEEYGINIIKIKEITQMVPITPVPHAPVFVDGVINLRGKVIPVINLRKKFGMDQIEFTDRTCMIVVEINIKDELYVIANIVDSVTEVFNVKDSDIEETPAFEAQVDTQYILGMATVGESVKILLDIDSVANIFNEDEKETEVE